MQISLWPILANSFVLRSCHCLIWRNDYMTLSGTVRSIADYTQRVIISDTASPSHYPCLCCLTSRARLYVGLLRHRSRLVCTIAYLLHEFVTYVGYRPSEPARWMDDVKARDSRELNSRKPVRFKRRRRRRRAFPKSHDTYHWQADKRISRITSKTPPQSKWLLNNKKQTNKKKGRPSNEEEEDKNRTGFSRIRIDDE